MQCTDFNQLLGRAQSLSPSATVAMHVCAFFFCCYLHIKYLACMYLKMLSSMHGWWSMSVLTESYKLLWFIKWHACVD